MSARRAQVDGTTVHFDHGAQYFTAKDPRFAAQIAQWEKAGVVAPWTAAKEGAWVGTPGMNAPIKAMAEEQDVQFGVRVDAIRREGKALWLVAGDDPVGHAFDAVIVAVPAEQVGPLLAEHEPQYAELAAATVSDPCWTLMVAFDAPVDHAGTLRNSGAIGWAARNSAKPGRDPSMESWVVQASPDWSREHLELDAAEVADLLLTEFASQAGDLPAAVHTIAHRWRYAQSGGAGETALWSSESSIGACGDWLVGPRVESAFISGIELAEKILADG